MTRDPNPTPDRFGDLIDEAGHSDENSANPPDVAEGERVTIYVCKCGARYTAQHESDHAPGCFGRSAGRIEYVPASELERLEAEYENLRGHRDRLWKQRDEARRRFERLEAERDRLRAALRSIEQLPWYTPAKIARTALAQTDTGGGSE